MEKDKIYEVTDEDRTFFDDLVNRTPEGIIAEPEEPIIEEVVEKKVEPEVIDPKLPTWYKPHMKYRVGWLNGVPQKPLSREDRKREYGRGRWVGSPEY